MLLISSLTDAATFVGAHEALFARKAKSVTIMGGAAPLEIDTAASVASSPRGGGGSPAPGEAHGPLDGGAVVATRAPIAADNSQNIMFDAAAAAMLYAACQRLAVPLTLLSRHAAYACPVPRAAYDAMAATRHAVARRLASAQRHSIEGLWARACLPPGDGARLGLPARCDKSW